MPLLVVTSSVGKSKRPSTVYFAEASCVCWELTVAPGNVHFHAVGPFLDASLKTTFRSFEAKSQAPPLMALCLTNRLHTALSSCLIVAMFRNGTGKAYCASVVVIACAARSSALGLHATLFNTCALACNKGRHKQKHTDKAVKFRLIDDII